MRSYSGDAKSERLHAYNGRVLKLETNWTQWSERGQKKNEDEKGIQGSSVEEVKVSPSLKGWGGLQ